MVDYANWFGGEQQYFLAACGRGHIVTAELRSPDDATVGRRCRRCRAPVLTQCPACNKPFPGSTTTSTLIVLPDTRPDPFCECGETLPWATRAEQVDGLKSYLEFHDLPYETQQQLIEQLAVLEKPLTEEVETEQRRVMVWIQQTAPGYWLAARPAITALLADAVREELGR